MVSSVSILCVPCAGVVLLLTFLAGWIMCKRDFGRCREARFLYLIITGGCLLASSRLLAFWFLLFQAHIGYQQKASLLPLVLMMCPEALLVPRGVICNTAGALFFSGALVMDSFLIEVVVAILLSLAQQLHNGPVKEKPYYRRDVSLRNAQDGT